MKSRAGLFLTCAAAFVGAMAIGPQARAQSADDVASVANISWYRGYVEAGGRVFLNDPLRDGIRSQGGQSLAKFYEYTTLKPGPFLDIYLATGTNDGLYRADFWGTNVGYSDQNYWLNLSKAGEQYLTLGWDQTPHVYSTSALTLYNGVGTNALTLPAGLSNALFLAAGCTRVAGKPPAGAGCGTLTVPQAAAVQALINANVHHTDIGIRRDTASVEYRYTPADAWDIRVNYSDMYRSGTQIEGVVFSPGTSGVTSQVPKPVSDSTQNYGASGEYAGTSLWGQKFNVKLAYIGSTFQEDFATWTVQNPFCPTGAGPGECARTASPSSPLALMSSWPSNQANGFTGTLGADLPGKSRYMGTISYTMMRQNEAFPPFTISPTVYTNAANTIQGAVPGLPAASLNGAINTLLFNNVLTTQLTPELKTKFTYRLYDIQNNTPELLFPNWVLTDVKLASQQSAPYAPVRSISISYTKQNAGAEVNWRPSHEWNLGAAYGFERYDWTRADADVTNENSGKFYVDWKPISGVTARASVFYSQRRYDNYNYAAFVQAMQWPNTVPGASTAYSPAYRQFFIDNRDRNQGKLSLAADLSSSLTITPTFGWRYDDYNLNPNTEVGLNLDHSWNSGAEVMYLVAPGTNFLFSYIYEYHRQLLTSCGQTIPSACAAAAYYSANVQDRVNTFIVAVNHEWIPNKLDVRIGYTLSYARNSQPLVFANGTGPTVASGGQYPDVRTAFQRLEAIAKYRFDDDVVQRLGWKGNVSVKLRYAWERTSVTNWQDDMMQTYMYSPAFTSVGYMDWLAFNNPNYNVHLIMASLAFTW
jgi:MtrB/PioB family decaheme-associated outer membrane protein